MKILDIQHLNNNTSITIEFAMEEQTIQGKALYYMICAVDKMQDKNYQELELLERMQVDARLDAAVDFINEMRK